MSKDLDLSLAALSSISETLWIQGFEIPKKVPGSSWAWGSCDSSGWLEGEDREKRLEEAEKARKLVLSGRTSIGREPNQWRAGLRFSQFQPPHKTRLASASQGVQKRWLVREHIHHWQTRLPTEPTTRTIVPYSPRSAAPTHRVSLKQEVFYCHPATPRPSTPSPTSFDLILPIVGIAVLVLLLSASSCRQ